MTDRSDFDFDAAPFDIAHVELAVRDLGTARFYRDALGLTVHDEQSDRVTLGAAKPFLTLVEADGAEADDPRRPGLFHVAIHLPSAQALSDWLAFALRAEVPLTGASDHGASRAIYLDDPEGNGIEIYTDYPTATWTLPDGSIKLTTDPLDMQAMPAPDGWDGVPDGTRIGHVHLRVSDTAESEAFWTGLGFDLTARYPGASFFGSGGYHHQIAGNTWHTRTNRLGFDPDSLGLSRLTLAASKDALSAMGTPPTTDPSGLPLGFVAKG